MLVRLVFLGSKIKRDFTDGESYCRTCVSLGCLRVVNSLRKIRALCDLLASPTKRKKNKRKNRRISKKGVRRFFVVV